ncbi:MAG TPA: hypothetical protein VER03_12300 [Bryobacteraceae bacterium]|nr:hypothetical protein [Bryobacteraceae bacterium]
MVLSIEFLLVVTGRSSGLGFAIGILTHGLLDYASHSYSIKSGIDVVLSTILVARELCFGFERRRCLVAVATGYSLFCCMRAVTGRACGCVVGLR